MRWPWSRPVRDPQGLAESRKMLAKARADEPRVSNIVTALHRKQAANHFGQRIHDALKEGR